MTNEFQKIESTISDHAVTLGVLVKSVNNIEGSMAIGGQFMSFSINKLKLMAQ